MPKIFIIEDEEIENKKTLDSDDLLLEALTYIKKDREDMLSGRARVLGFNMEGESPTSIRAFLNKMAKDPRSVRKVINAYQSDSVAIQLLFMRAMDNEVIVENRGAFMYGTTILGITQDSVIDYLKDPLNKEVALEIEKELRSKTSSSNSTEPESTKTTTGKEDDEQEGESEDTVKDEPKKAPTKAGTSNKKK
jgi:hypothetical protein